MIHTMMALDKMTKLASEPHHHEAHFQGFLDFRGAKMPQNGLKMGSFHPFVHPKWSRMRFGNMCF